MQLSWEGLFPPEGEKFPSRQNRPPEWRFFGK